MTSAPLRPPPPAASRPPRPLHAVCDVGFPLAYTPGSLVVLDGDLELALGVLEHISSGLIGVATPMWDHVPVLTARPPRDTAAHSLDVVQRALTAGRPVVVVGAADAAAISAGEPLADLTVMFGDGESTSDACVIRGSLELGLQAEAHGPSTATRTLGLMTALAQSGLLGVRNRGRRR